MRVAQTVRRRINISLPHSTVAMIDRLARKGDRCRLIQQAVDHYVEAVGHKRIRGMLIEGGMKRAARDRSLAEEWFAIDDAAWENSPR